MSAVGFALAQLIHTVIQLYIWVIIIVAILSFANPNPTNPTVRSIIITLFRITEPVFAWVREKMPFLIINGIDLSPIVIILGLDFLDNLIIGLLVR